MGIWRPEVAAAVVLCLLQSCSAGDENARPASDSGVDASTTISRGTADGIAPRVDTVDGVPRWIHDSAAYAGAPRWTLDTALLGETPGAGGDAAFDLTHSYLVRLTSDNQVVALAPVGNAFTVFSAEGKPRRRFFRTGKGPGDLMAPSGMLVLPGDTILIPDEGNQRLNWVHTDKGFVRSAPMAPLAGSERLYVSDHVGMLGSRLLAVAHRYGKALPGSDSSGRADIRVLQLEQSGALVNEVARLLGPPVAPYESRYRGRVAVQREPPRLAHHPTYAVWNGQVVIGAGPRYELAAWTAAGKPVARLTVAVPRVAVTEAMRARIVAKELERFRGQQSERMVDPAESRRLIEVQPWADSVPVFGNLHAAPGGLLWVSSYPMGDQTEPWSATAFGPGGRLIGRLQGRTGGVPMAFGADRVVVREEDEDGVVRLRIYRMLPPR